ncbi:MAG TPA: aminotransferase class I/II-fold pyridoxal phosphate-dependent enzyme [Vicinamibacterales bacterium]
MTRVYLSPPDVGAAERELLLDAFDSNWIAPLGPHVDAFEREFASVVGVPHAVALSSGTAALHLALLALDVKPGDEILVSTMTFAATANAVVYVGGVPAFIDASPDTWTMDPDLLEEELARRAARGKLPAAVVAVDLYGQCCDYARIAAACEQYGVPLVEDAAEALGGTYGDRPAGGFGRCAAFSFNGNKIITTSGGGMLVSHSRAVADLARQLAAQARDPAPHYQHSRIGFNYRLSNLLAAIGRAQLQSLDGKIARRRTIRARYSRELGPLGGIRVLEDAGYGRSNAWLTCITVDAGTFGASNDAIRAHLESQDVESRPVWKPMHLQPVFRDCRVSGGSVAAGLFATGLCLPSGSRMSPSEQARVINGIEETPRFINRLQAGGRMARV